MVQIKRLMASLLPWLLLSGPVLAQESVEAYPSRPVTTIIPLTPGGGGDVEARLYNQRLTESMGRPFINDYKPGAGTTIGTAYVAKSKPDGYTLLAISPTITIAAAFYPDLPYDINKDLTALSKMSTRASMLAINPAFTVKNMGEFVAYAKANPGKLNWGTHGAGSASHLSGAWIQSLTNTKFTFVHYKGSSPLARDLVAGHVQASVLVFSSSLPLAKAGKVKALAMSSAERSPLLSGLATVQEQGVPEFEYPSWLGIFGPGGMAPALVAKLSGELSKAAKHPEVVKTLGIDGTVAVGSSSEHLKQVVATQFARVRKIVQENGIKLDE